MTARGATETLRPARGNGLNGSGTAVLCASLRRSRSAPIWREMRSRVGASAAEMPTLDVWLDIHERSDGGEDAARRIDVSRRFSSKKSCERPFSGRLHTKRQPTKHRVPLRQCFYYLSTLRRLAG